MVENNSIVSSRWTEEGDWDPEGKFEFSAKALVHLDVKQISTLYREFQKFYIPFAGKLTKLTLLTTEQEETFTPHKNKICYLPPRYNIRISGFDFRIFQESQRIEFIHEDNIRKYNCQTN